MPVRSKQRQTSLPSHECQGEANDRAKKCPVVVLTLNMKDTRMPYYCVNKQAQDNGDHEVHRLDSQHGCLPAAHNQHQLGYHDHCASAVAAARLKYNDVDGCYYCSNACHTS